jgi:uroporphyrinogen-III synthase
METSHLQTPGEILDRPDGGARNGGTEIPDVSLLHALASRMAGAAPLPEVLREVVELTASLVPCDSCFIYVLEDSELVLQASKNPHPEVVNRLKMKIGQGITGWVAARREPVVIARAAYSDSRFRLFSELPEDRFEAFLSVPLVSGGRLVGVINLQNREPHQYSSREISLVAMLGFLVGAEIERIRLESENSLLADRLETRTFVERAKGILQRDLGVGEDEAYRVMQKESQQRRTSMKQIAEAIILSDSLRSSRTHSATRKNQTDMNRGDKKIELDFPRPRPQNPCQ